MNVTHHTSGPGPGIQRLVIRPMTEAYLDQVMAIERESFPVPWTRSHFRDELASPLAFPQVAVDSEGTVAGYICPVQILDEGQILDVAVRGDSRGAGIGRLLVEKVLGEFLARGASSVFLEVRRSNDSARHLYQRLGFVEFGCRKRYYEDGEDAILMNIALSGDILDAV